MKFEQRPTPQETTPQPQYIINGKKISRDDILQEAALILESNPRFPNLNNKQADHLRARQALREVLKKHGAQNDVIEKLEEQIRTEADAILDLF